MYGIAQLRITSTALRQALVTESDRAPASGEIIMTTAMNPKIDLTLIHPVPGAHILKAPPVLMAGTHTVDYCCGNCGAILLRAEKDQVHGLNIQCAICGCTSATDE